MKELSVQSPFSPFDRRSGPTEPVLEFVFEIEAQFDRMDTIPDLPSGHGRGFVSLSGGKITGPKLNGVILPGTGGDWAMFRPDEVLSSDARYMLQADDGTQILMLNRGYVWGRQPDTMQRMRRWMFEDGPALEFEEFYLRSSPTFEAPKGKYEWMMRHIFIGIGRRQRHGNTIRYYALL